MTELKDLKAGSLYRIHDRPVVESKMSFFVMCTIRDGIFVPTVAVPNNSIIMVLRYYLDVAYGAHVVECLCGGKIGFLRFMRQDWDGIVLTEIV